MSAPQKITEIWAWVITQPDGGEGIPAGSFLPGHLVPCLGADEARVRSLELEARAIAAVAGLPIKLMRFTHGEVVETA